MLVLQNAMITRVESYELPEFKTVDAKLLLFITNAHSQSYFKKTRIIENVLC